MIYKLMSFKERAKPDALKFSTPPYNFKKPQIVDVKDAGLKSLIMDVLERIIPRPVFSRTQ